MKNYILYLLIFIFISFGFIHGSCRKFPDNGRLFPIEVKRSVIGITGKDSSAPYIEIFYTRKKTDTSNEIVHEWVKPPYLFGDVPVMSQFRKRCWDYCQKAAYLTYTEGGDSYLRIINHSSNPIEMFVVQNLPIKIYKTEGTFCDCPKNPENIVRYPIPLYQKAPIYYLLYPDRVPNLIGLNVLEDNCCKVRNLSYTPTQVGDITLTRAWTVEEVMKLYRAEYRKSSDTVLYKYYTSPQETRISTYKKYYLNEQNTVSYYDPTNNIYYPENMYGFYKQINGLDSFVSANEKWYPMTNAIDDARDY